MRLLNAFLAALALASATCVAGAAVTLRDVRIRVMERTGDKLFEQTVKYPDAYTETPAISGTTPFSISFTAMAGDKERLELDQAFVNFRHAESGEEAVFMAKMGKTGDYRLDLARKQFRQQLARRPGKYSVSLVLGSYEHWGTVYRVGDVIVKGKQPQQQPQQQAMARPWGPKEPIAHKFGEPQRMPPVVLSLAATLLVLAPLGVLGVVWARLGVNMRAADGRSAAFLAMVAAYVALAVAYWVGVRLFPTLAYALVLALPTYATGRAALSGRNKAAAS
ncbi:proteasome regulatory particle base subunit [Coemansia sp. Benny D115]|nr:proteasome regulatory particle base subunit [Coemansia sp. Benny D115]